MAAVNKTHRCSRARGRSELRSLDTLLVAIGRRHSENSPVTTRSSASVDRFRRRRRFTTSEFISPLLASSCHGRIAPRASLLTADGGKLRGGGDRAAQSEIGAGAGAARGGQRAERDAPH